MKKPALSNTKIQQHIFMAICFIIIFYLLFIVFKPFLGIIVLSGVIVTIFYPIYKKTLKTFGSKNLASFLMCALILLIIILPFFVFLILLAQNSINAYEIIKDYFLGEEFSGKYFQSVDYWKIFKAKYLFFIDFSELNSYFVSEIPSATLKLISAITDFLAIIAISFPVMIITLFFMFRDGDKLLKKLMYLTPFDNKYDREIFTRFQNISRSAIVSDLIVAVVQGLLGGISFAIVGFPIFFPMIFIAVLSVLPYLNAGIIWVPAGIVLLFQGKIWQGIFILAWGGLIIGLVDNLIRPYLMQRKDEVHPLLILFSILGGIFVFGIWGFIFGPIILVVGLSFIHIYELEYKSKMKKKKV